MDELNITTIRGGVKGGVTDEQVKQVLVYRTKYPDGNGGTRKLRTGKTAAQLAHASMAWLSHRVRASFGDFLNMIPGKMSAYPGTRYTTKGEIGFTPEECAWLSGRFTKVVVYVETEEELLAVHQAAQEAGLTSYLITDAGLTEFDGQPTNTCVGIGPNFRTEIDKITGHLPLL